MDEKQQNWCDQEQDSHIGHMAATEQSHMFMQACYGKLCVFYWKFVASVDRIWQKMPHLIHGNPSFQNVQFGGTNIVLKPMVFSTFLKHAISKFVRSTGLDIALF